MLPLQIITPIVIGGIEPLWSSLWDYLLHPVTLTLSLMSSHRFELSSFECVNNYTIRTINHGRNRTYFDCGVNTAFIPMNLMIDETGRNRTYSLCTFVQRMQPRQHCSKFPYRELNPGLLGENQVSVPLDHMGGGKEGIEPSPRGSKPRNATSTTHSQTN